MYFDDKLSCIWRAVVRFQTEVNARRIVTSVGDSLFKHGVVTWCRVISLLAVAAAVATECSQTGNTQLIPAVVAAVTDVVERHAASWISLQGGWVGPVAVSARVPDTSTPRHFGPRLQTVRYWMCACDELTD